MILKQYPVDLPMLQAVYRLIEKQKVGYFICVLSTHISQFHIAILVRHFWNLRQQVESERAVGSLRYKSDIDMFLKSSLFCISIPPFICRSVSLFTTGK